MGWREFVLRLSSFVFRPSNKEIRVSDLNAIRRVVLENGLTVLLREMHHAPVASFWVWYRVGSRNERAGVTGISHWTEHMLFKGTPTYPQGEFDKAVAREGGVFNGMTWIDFTTSRPCLLTGSIWRCASRRIGWSMPCSTPKSSSWSAR
jgi:hypothetical protein